jgi:hypothetical protein
MIGYMHIDGMVKTSTCFSCLYNRDLWDSQVWQSACNVYHKLTMQIWVAYHYIFLSLISDNFIFSWNEEGSAVCILFETLLHASNAWMYLSKHGEWHKNSINEQHMWGQVHFISNSFCFIEMCYIHWMHQ